MWKSLRDAQRNWKEILIPIGRGFKKQSTWLTGLSIREGLDSSYERNEQ